MLPATNATLTAIRPVEASEDGDYDDASEDAWTGELGIWVSEEEAESADGETVDELIQTRLEIPYAVGKQVTRGDVLAYTFDGTAFERRASTIMRASLVGRVKVLVTDK